MAHSKKNQTFLRGLLRHEATDATNNDRRPRTCRSLPNEIIVTGFLKFLAVILFKVVFHHLDNLALPGRIDDHLLGELLAVAAVGTITMTVDLAAEEGGAETVEITIVDAYVPGGRLVQEFSCPLLKLLFGSVVGVTIYVSNLLDILTELWLQEVKKIALVMAFEIGLDYSLDVAGLLVAAINLEQVDTHIGILLQIFRTYPVNLNQLVGILEEATTAVEITIRC